MNEQEAAVDLDILFNGGNSRRNIDFVLLAFPYGNVEGARCNYISNGADRKDIVCFLK